MQLSRKSFDRTDHHPFKVCKDFACPICTKSIAQFKIKPKLKQAFFGDSPAPFVGRFGYPTVNVGMLNLPQHSDISWKYDAPRFWSKENTPIASIVDYRTSLINSSIKAPVKQTNKIIQISQEVGLASKPVEIEMSLTKAPVLRLSTDPMSAPHGATAAIKNVRITSNPKISIHVEKTFSEVDMPASEASAYLYKHGYDEYTLSKLLSVGTLGIQTNRKLVPTRWSITAADDILGKQMISRIRDMQSIDSYNLYFGGHLGNYFAIIMLPNIWSYELFETLAGTEDYTTDYEFYEGRNSYVSETAGGYYAARLPILEKLAEKKRQASVIAIRIITEEYSLPLGVWVVREAVRKALQGKPLAFASKDALFAHLTPFINRRFNHSINNMLNNSQILDRVQHQKNLMQYMV